MPQTDDFMATLLADIEKRDAERIEAAKAKLRKEVIPKLKKQGAATIQAHYSGYGDSGTIDTIEYLDDQHKPMKLRKSRSATSRPTFDDSVHDALYGFLPSGFEIDDGGQGDITIDVQSGKITLEHQENYVQHNDTTLEFTL